MKIVTALTNIPRIQIMATSHLRPATLALAAAFFVAAVAATDTNSAPTVTIAQGSLAGASNGTVVEYLGIPFAAPPIGENRWRSPQPASRWSGVRKADRFAASCFQDLTPKGFGPWTPEYVVQDLASEDCLYLNVWAPSAKAQKLPVLMWFYGGAFTSGSGSVPVYNGAALAARGMLVVNANYRLGALGFMAHPELTKEGGGSSGNYAIEDMVAALQWVKANIAAFGGDPSQVTIAGQSAGAAAVHNLVASPLAKGLFIRAIAQSGSGMGIGSAPLGAAEKTGMQLMAKTGTKSVAEMRRLSPEAIGVAAKGTPGDRSTALRFGPIVDGRIIPQDPSGAGLPPVNDTPILTGMTADEGSSGDNYGVSTPTALRSSIERSFGGLASEAKEFYAATSDKEAGEISKAVGRDRGIASAYVWALDRSRNGRSPIYFYLFTHPEPGPDAAKYGAFHSSEIPYVFQTLDKSPGRPFTASDHMLSETMASYWTNFVRTGNPNGPRLPKWPAFAPQDPELLEIGDMVAAKPVMTVKKRDFYTRFVGQGGKLGLF